MLYFKSFESIQLSDIEFLKTVGITEGRFLDYKESPPSLDSRGFLEAAVAMANSQGGVIVYGVKELRSGNEKTGKIGEICGFESTALDSVKSRLESQIRDQIQPRLEYRMKDLTLPNGKHILLVRINQGWLGPYFFKFQKGLFFYRRAESQNIQLDYPEIKVAFLSSDTLKDKLSGFREKRVQGIISQQMPFDMDGERIFIAHVLSLDGFREGTILSQLIISQNVASVGPLSGQGHFTRPNIDGLFQYWSGSQADHTKPISYVQFFRNGAVEYADSFLLKGTFDEDQIHIKSLGDRLSSAIRRAIVYQKSLGFGGPFYIAVSMWNVKGVKLMQANDAWSSDKTMRFDRDHIHLPVFEIEDPSENEFTVARPVLDMICNAAGWEKCLRYDMEGAWS